MQTIYLDGETNRVSEAMPAESMTINEQTVTKTVIETTIPDGVDFETLAKQVNALRGSPAGVPVIFKINIGAA